MSDNCCPRGHSLFSKKVTGGIFGSVKHTCSACLKPIEIGQVRHTCKVCDYHLCPWCVDAISRTPSRVVLGADLPVPEPPLQAGQLETTVAVAAETRALCKYGSECYSVDPEHRRCFAHPPGRRVACRWGSECYRRQFQHLEDFVHPGDRNYRVGLVIFRRGQQPDFQNSLWQLFQFYDPDESGHLSKEEFAEALKACTTLGTNIEEPSLDQAWEDAGGPAKGYVNFRQFASWTKEFLALEYPLGLDTTSVRRPCRFRLKAGSQCSCAEFVGSVSGSDLCECGHKPSMHRSDFAKRTITKFLEDSRDCDTKHWVPDQEGLVKITDEDLLSRLQELLTATHKPSPDNWTRDRGCSLHGVHGCTASCASKNRAPVPSGYFLVSAYRNQNADLWQKYSLCRTAISEECAGPCKEVVHKVRGVATSGWKLEADVDSSVNEWYLFHGSSASRCKNICSINFRLAMAGTGATWKDPGKDIGTPLYGYGIYLAERITKADEYSGILEPEQAQTTPVVQIPEDAGPEIFTALLCRIIGGRTNVVMTNEIEVEKLREDVFQGPFNSVFGDRVTTLGKPYREVVIYDKDQCYPEFLLMYTRSFG